MKYTRKSRLMALSVAGVMAVGLLGAAGVAMAQSPGDGSSAQHLGAHRGRIFKSTMKQIVESSELSPEVFNQGFKDGKSINTILTENGVDPATVQAAVLAALDAKLDEKVLAGDLTQEKADALYARAETALPKLMDHTPQPGEHRGKIAKALRGAIKTAAETIGIEPQELAGALKGGQSIADVASANGVDPQTVVDALVAQASAKLDEAVANGRISEEKAAEIKSGLPERMTELVNKSRQPNP
ncbi:MAG: hypothetical protein HY875_06025 [Chloroflexi bacterium]|nr:hypothetical protein [Chloroflexota bacterium]